MEKGANKRGYVSVQGPWFPISKDNRGKIYTTYICLKFGRMLYRTFSISKFFVSDRLAQSFQDDERLIISMETSVMILHEDGR